MNEPSMLVGDAPDLDAMRGWLSRVSLVARGAVPSWICEERPGYAYPEAAGIVLRVLAPFRDEAVPVVARWLTQQVLPSGLVARGEVAYAFDTGIALVGLLAAERAGVTIDETLLQRMAAGLRSTIEARIAAQPSPVTQRWSTRWSCHQLKLVEALLAWEVRTHDPATRALVDRLAAELLPLEEHGRFRLSADDDRSYVHASCYALEGALALTPTERAPLLLRGATWLSSLQAPDGTLPAWIGGSEEPDKRPSDVIAQAVRLWARIDGGRHRAEVQRGLGALTRRQHPSGGVLYLAAGADPVHVNVWCTAFAIEAVLAIGEGG